MREVSWNLSQSEIDLLDKRYEGTLVVDAHSDTIWVKSLEEWGKKPDFFQADPNRINSFSNAHLITVSGNGEILFLHLIQKVRLRYRCDLSYPSP